MSYKEISVGEVSKYTTSGGTPKSNINEYYNPPSIPWLKTKEVNYCRIYETETSISEEGLEKSSAKLIPPNSVIVAMYGQGNTAGRVAINKIPLATNQACCNLIIDEEKANYEFVYYALSALYDKLVSLKNGGAQPNLNATLVRDIKIPYPDLSIQHRIADILSAYDDLIENNRKQIKLLEEAAQRLYKEWFVDLRFPGHEHTKIVDGVPEGWEVDFISNIVKTTSGGTPARSHPEYYVNGSNLWVKTQELTDSFILDTEEKITDEAIENSSAKLVPKGSILMAMYGATIGKLGIATQSLTCNQACCVYDTSEFKYGAMYLFCWLLQNRSFLIKLGKGVAQSNLSQAMIKNLNILVPSPNVLYQFSCFVDSLYSQILTHQRRITILSEARDRLLPKLMSGEVEV